jgi:hypothetical protein
VKTLDRRHIQPNIWKFNAHPSMAVRGEGIPKMGSGVLPKRYKYYLPLQIEI